MVKNLIEDTKVRQWNNFLGYTVAQLLVLAMTLLYLVTCSYTKNNLHENHSPWNDKQWIKIMQHNE